jgi:hypothetical protein
MLLVSTCSLKTIKVAKSFDNEVRQGFGMGLTVVGL